MNPDAIPEELRERDQWICWRTECRGCGERLNPTTKECRECGDKATKKPIEPGGGYASSTDPDTWGSLDDTQGHAEGGHDVDGVGFVFDANGLIAGVDLDGCRDPETGDVDGWAEAVVDELNSYTEVSPSGTGLHVYVYGFVPDGGNRNDALGIEIYDSGRYFTVTGEHVSGTPEAVEQRQSALANVHAARVVDDEPEPDRADPPEEVDLDDAELLKKAKNAENGDRFARLWDGDTSMHDNDHSRADLALLCHLAFWTGGDRDRMERLFEQSGLVRDKWRDRRDYRERTIDAALASTTDFYDPGKAKARAAPDGGATATAQPGAGAPGPEPGGDGDDDGPPLVPLFREACKFFNIKTGKVNSYRNGDDVLVEESVQDILDDDGPGVAITSFNDGAGDLSGKQRQGVIARVISRHLEARGEFFRTPQGAVYFYHEEAPEDADSRMYRVDGDGNRVLAEDFQAAVWEWYHLFAGQFSRNLGRDILSYIRRNAPEREVHRFAHYDETTGEVYITDHGDGYYAVTTDGVEWRANGTDLFFLGLSAGEPYEYLEPDDRPDLTEDIPGERSVWGGNGDAIMRLFGNRVNYSEGAALGPLQQRQQLYLHLHTLPFGSVLIGKPIMAWVGDKGSGKTMTSRAIGRFIVGPEFTESAMPDERDDFEAKVVNQPLAFIDNYDEGQKWANSILASIATGGGLDKRELYTTTGLRSEVPDCWLSITSREPPFRRDDVADRLLLFHVERFEGDFIGEGHFLKEVEPTEEHPERRDLLWSVYLDNIHAVLRELESRDLGSMSSSHRMAGWAIYARVIADALGVDDVDELLETMQAERATFALEEEPWASVIGKWIDKEPGVASEYLGAGDIHEWLESTADEHDMTYHVSGAGPLGKKLSKYRDELGTVYGLEIDEAGSRNQYRFESEGGVGLGRFG